RADLADDAPRPALGIGLHVGSEARGHRNPRKAPVARVGDATTAARTRRWVADTLSVPAFQTTATRPAGSARKGGRRGRAQDRRRFHRHHATAELVAPRERGESRLRALHLVAEEGVR